MLHAVLHAHIAHAMLGHVYGPMHGQRLSHVVRGLPLLAVVPLDVDGLFLLLFVAVIVVGFAGAAQAYAIPPHHMSCALAYCVSH